MKQTIITLNLEMLKGISNVAMAYRKGSDQIPLLVARIDPREEPREGYITLDSLFDEDTETDNSKPISVKYVELDLSKGEPALILIEEHENEDRICSSKE